MIEAQALVDKFRQALNDKWGYIWGAAGIMWTKAKQDQKVSYMVSKYGSGWKTSKEAKDDNYYGSAYYGDKWIGHYVADCSGLFSWAFKELGGSIAHGSNSIWDRYCASKGKLSGGRRTDGQELLPGTAVFTGTDSSKPHIGLYVGNGTVIEASGSNVGVITTDIGNSKWKYWGQLKDVNYNGGGGDQPVPKGKAIVTGKRVALRTAPTTQASIIMRIDTGKQVDLNDPPPDEWDYVSYQGKTGWMMKKFLKEGE